MASFLDEFLVKLGWSVDEASAKKAASTADEVEGKVRAADQRLTESNARENAKRQAQDARARGEKLKGAGEIIDSIGEQQAAEEKAAKAATKRSEQQRKAQREADKASKAALQSAVISGNLIADAIEKVAEVTVRALGLIIDRFDRLAFVSQRTGVSVSRIKSLGYAFSQVGGSAEQASAVVEKFAYALRNPGIKSFLNNTLGVATEDATGRAVERTKVLLSAFDAIEKKYPGQDKSYIREQYSSLFGMSYEDFDLLDRRREQIRAYSAEYERIAKTIGLNSDDAAKSSAGFSRALGSFQAVATALGEKLLTVLVPPLEQLVRTFVEWIEAHPEQVNRIVENLGKALFFVAETVGSLVRLFGKLLGDTDVTERFERWTKSLTEFAETVERIVTAVGELEKKFAVFKKLQGLDRAAADFLSDPFGIRSGVQGYLFGSPAQAAPSAPPVGPSTPGDSAGQPGVFRRALDWGRGKLGFGGGGGGASSGGGGSSSSTATPSGSDAGSLTALINKAAADAGIDPRIMHGIRAGESLKGDKYDVKSDAAEDSHGPFQLNRRGGLGQVFEKQTGLDARDPKTIPDQAAFVARHIAQKLKANPNYNPGKEWYGYKGLTNPDPKWGNSGYVPSQGGTETAAKDGVGAVDQRQGGARYRRLPITDELRKQLATAARESGVNAEVFSGGQDEHRRTGGHRHDDGKAADLKLYRLGLNGQRQYLSMNDPEQRTVMEKFIKESVKAGANGVGGAPNYMGERGLHVGGGSPAAWGADRTSASAPDWLRRAHQNGLRARGADKVSSMLDGAVKAADRLQTSIEGMPVAWLDKAQQGLSQAKDAVGKVDLDGIRQTANAAPALMPTGGTTVHDNRQFHEGPRTTTVSGVNNPQEAADYVNRSEKRTRTDLIDNFRNAYA